jgi:heme/copper-type cytochrome/quinol oxidase subunit 2
MLGSLTGWGMIAIALIILVTLVILVAGLITGIVIGVRRRRVQSTESTARR